MNPTPETPKTVYLSDPEEMRRRRLNQRPMSCEEFLAQQKRIKAAAEQFFDDAKKETSSRGHGSVTA